MIYDAEGRLLHGSSTAIGVDRDRALRRVPARSCSTSSQIPLLDGEYSVTLCVTSSDGAYIYDWHEQRYRFEVRDPKRSFGSVDFPVRISVDRRAASASGHAGDRRARPRVRVVVLNYDGGDMTLRCLEALRAVDWPARRARDRAGRQRVDRRPRAAACAADAARGCSSSSTPTTSGSPAAATSGSPTSTTSTTSRCSTTTPMPDRNWLRPLVDALEHDDSLGAACSKIVFAPSFLTLTIETPTFRPARRRPRARREGHRPRGRRRRGLGARAVRRRLPHRTRHAGRAPSSCVWTAGHAEIRIPVEVGARAARTRSRSSSRRRGTKLVRARARAATSVEVTVGETPTWHQRARSVGPTYDVINNVGSRLVLGGYGGDRGFLEPDAGQYAQPEEVFAWCGGAVLLSARYLREVGIFDDRYFMYYEDTDLSWRGRLAGLALPLRARVGRAPRARGVEQGGLRALHALRRAQPLPHPGPQCAVVDVRRGVVRVPARHRGDPRSRRRPPHAPPQPSGTRASRCGASARTRGS